MGGIIKLDQKSVPTLEPFDATKSMMALLKQQYQTLTNLEFDQFIATAKAMGLNPIKRQIAPVVFNKTNSEKRQMAIVTTIMGLRAIADRTGSYRPDPLSPRYELDRELVSKVNPLGLISCTVAPEKFVRGEWSPAPGEVFWDEIAPIRQYKDEAPYLDKRTMWPSRPRGQLSKCAEADGLRKGWPEDFSNVYVEEEVQKSILLDASPSELAEAGGVDNRLAKTSTNNTIMLMFGTAIEAVEIGQVHDRCEAFIQEHKENTTLIMNWHETNMASLRHFWALRKDEALHIKQLLEGVLASGAVQEG